MIEDFFEVFVSEKENGKKRPREKKGEDGEKFSLSLQHRSPRKKTKKRELAFFYSFFFQANPRYFKRKKSALTAP